MANIKDVAARAGVSVTTVSHVVNGTRFVMEASRKRVEEAVRELGYVPSAVARSLKHHATHTFGMLIPNNSNPYFAEVLRGVESRCFKAGYNVILGNSDDDPARQASYLRVLAEKRVDGLVLVSSSQDPRVTGLMGEMKIPLVLLDREIPGLDCDLVEVDHVTGGRLATEHLLGLGHPRVACISGPPGLAPSSQRRAGWKQALADAGVEREAGDLARGDFSPRGGFLAMQTLLRRHPRPSAVFVCNDMMAFGALAAAREAGIQVPGQLSIVGYDDIQLAAYSAPPLTTVVQPKLQIGTLAAEMLLDRVAGKPGPPRRALLEPLLKVRATTAPHSSLQPRSSVP
jgi:LacI family transcriptional regulator